jgi:SAM-dependent methyltransferase
MALREIDWARAYGTWGEVGEGYSTRRITESLADWLPRGAARVLELGCAPGRWLAWCERELGAEVHGVELNAEGARLSRLTSATAGVVRASADRLPYRDETFDAVFSLGLLEHFEVPSPILRESWRVLRPGGLTYALTPNIAAGTFQGWHWRTFNPENYAGHRPFTLGELEDELRRAGFETVHRDYLGLYVPHGQRLMHWLRLSPLARRLEFPRLATSIAVVGRRPGAMAKMPRGPAEVVHASPGR